MRQAQIVGYVGSKELLDEHPQIVSGLHYARLVVFGDWREGDKRIPTGRGKNASGVEAGSVAINRALVCWGKQSKVSTMISQSGRKCIIALVTGRNEKVKKHLQRLADAGAECHLMKVDESTAARVIVCDDAQCNVQIADHDEWVVSDTLLVRDGDQGGLTPKSLPAPAQRESAARPARAKARTDKRAVEAHSAPSEAQEQHAGEE